MDGFSLTDEVCRAVLLAHGACTIAGAPDWLLFHSHSPVNDWGLLATELAALDASLLRTNPLNDQVSQFRALHNTAPKAIGGEEAASYHEMGRNLARGLLMDIRFTFKLWRELEPPWEPMPDANALAANGPKVVALLRKWAPRFKRSRRLVALIENEGARAARGGNTPAAKPGEGEEKGRAGATNGQTAQAGPIKCELMANLPELIAQFQSAARFYYDLAFHNQDEAGTYAALRRLLEVGKALAVELEMAEKDSTELYRLLDAAFMGLEEDRYLSAWEPVRVSLARIATVVALTPPATETKQGEGKGGAGPVLIPAGAPDTRAADPDFQRRFMELAIKEARKSKAEDARVHPKVGVVVVKNGIPMATAYRGEMKEWEHAEYTALEGKLRDEVVAGATVYTTLEPCTSRHHPKIPCLERLIERKVKRVVIGMLDPDSRVSGKGQMRLRKANVAVCLFDHDLQPEIEELNRDFIRDREHANKQQSANKGEE